MTDQNADLSLDLRIKFAAADLADANHHHARVSLAVNPNAASRIRANLEIDAATERLKRLTDERDVRELREKAKPYAQVMGEYTGKSADAHGGVAEVFAATSLTIDHLKSLLGGVFPDGPGKPSRLAKTGVDGVVLGAALGADIALGGARSD